MIGKHHRHRNLLPPPPGPQPINPVCRPACGQEQGSGWGGPAGAWGVRTGEGGAGCAHRVPPPRPHACRALLLCSIKASNIIIENTCTHLQRYLQHVCIQGPHAPRAIPCSTEASNMARRFCRGCTSQPCAASGAPSCCVVTSVGPPIPPGGAWRGRSRGWGGGWGRKAGKGSRKEGAMATWES